MVLPGKGVATPARPAYLNKSNQGLTFNDWPTKVIVDWKDFSEAQKEWARRLGKLGEITLVVKHSAHRLALVDAVNGLT